MDHPPAPVAIVLGWGGARPKQLNRYVELYECRGFRVLRFIHDWTSLGQPAQGVAALDRFADEVRTALLPAGSRAIVHLFSNNGFFAYLALLRLAQCGPLLHASVAAHVFDSSPGIPDPVDGRGFAGIFGPGIGAVVAQALGLDPTVEHRWIERPLVPVFRLIWTAMPWLQGYVADARQRWRADAPSVPLLALYSPGDRLVDHRIVKEFIEEEQGRVTRVDARVFGDSPHVQHLRRYPDVYERAVEELLESVGLGAEAS